jgi:hypothetical protein
MLVDAIETSLLRRLIKQWSYSFRREKSYKFNGKQPALMGLRGATASKNCSRFIHLRHVLPAQVAAVGVVAELVAELVAEAEEVAVWEAVGVVAGFLLQMMAAVGFLLQSVVEAAAAVMVAEGVACK